MQIFRQNSQTKQIKLVADLTNASEHEAGEFLVAQAQLECDQRDDAEYVETFLNEDTSLLEAVIKNDRERTIVRYFQQPKEPTDGMAA